MTTIYVILVEKQSVTEEANDKSGRVREASMTLSSSGFIENRYSLDFSVREI